MCLGIGEYVDSILLTNIYREGLNSGPDLLSNSQAGPGRKYPQPRNLGTTFWPITVLYDAQRVVELLTCAKWRIGTVSSLTLVCRFAHGLTISLFCRPFLAAAEPRS